MRLRSLLRPGVLVSVALHGAVVAVALLAVARVRPAEPAPLVSAWFASDARRAPLEEATPPTGADAAPDFRLEAAREPAPEVVVEADAGPIALPAAEPEAAPSPLGVPAPPYGVRSGRPAGPAPAPAVASPAPRGGGGPSRFAQPSP